MPLFSILTPSGRGAVATLRVEGLAVLDGPSPLFVAANGKPMRRQPINRICFGRWGSNPSEDVVVCRIEADVVEIHCHGGDAAVARIAAELESRGCQRCSAWDVTEEWQAQRVLGDLRPPLAGDDARIEAECCEALTRATTLRTADILWQQCQGRLAAAIGALRTLSPDNAKSRAADMLRWAQFGRHLTQPWQVVLCGRPNVGKSSLINALVGFGRSIVFDQPGTTRDVVTVETALDGWPIEFSDTAGLRDDADELEAAGISRARRRLETADLRILVLDTSQPAHDDDRHLLTAYPDALVVAHKCDLPNRWGETMPAEAREVSSLTGFGVDELAQQIVARLVPEVPPPLTALPVHPSHAALIGQLAADR